jgi:hypothetical protein
MIDPGLDALKGHWDKEDYAARYRARLTAIPDFERLEHSTLAFAGFLTISFLY